MAASSVEGNGVIVINVWETLSGFVLPENRECDWGTEALKKWIWNLLLWWTFWKFVTLNAKYCNTICLYVTYQHQKCVYTFWMTLYNASDLNVVKHVNYLKKEYILLLCLEKNKTFRVGTKNLLLSYIFVYFISYTYTHAHTCGKSCYSSLLYHALCWEMKTWRSFTRPE
jgi:hypothetical protein